MIQVKSGATRHVVLIGGLAFKIPRLTHWAMFLQGLLANMQERTWSEMSDRLCPVKFALWGGFLTVMPRVEPLTAEQWEAMDKKAYRSFCSNKGKGFLPIEYKQCSFGMLQGTMVSVDYGT